MSERKWFTREKYNNMLLKAKDQALNLPSSARLRSAQNFEWENFSEEVYSQFVSRFVEEIDNAFEQLEFWMAFEIFDARKLPEKKKN